MCYKIYILQMSSSKKGKKIYNIVFYRLEIVFFFLSYIDKKEETQIQVLVQLCSVYCGMRFYKKPRLVDSGQNQRTSIEVNNQLHGESKCLNFFPVFTAVLST